MHCALIVHPAAPRRAFVDPSSAAPETILYLQGVIGNQAVGGILADAGFRSRSVQDNLPDFGTGGLGHPAQTAQAKPASQNTEHIPGKENRTGLPDHLKAGLENLSGISMDEVRVHYNSPKPAIINALAYTQGADIHIGPGQERHLPHEGWHVAQQKRGIVAPTTQLGSIVLNDDPGLESEADRMGKQASGNPAEKLNFKPLQTKISSNTPIQRVRGGIEYTEKTPVKLYRFSPQNTIDLTRAKTIKIGAQDISIFYIFNSKLPQLVNSDDTALQDGRVKLTNDVYQSEWVIEGHQKDLSVSDMLNNMKADIEKLFKLNKSLKSEFQYSKPDNVIQIAFTPGNVANLKNVNPNPGFFIYYPGELTGSVQITLQYHNEETIRKLNLLNISRYLTGTKADEKQYVNLVTNTDNYLINDLKYYFSQTIWSNSFYEAENLYNQLAEKSKKISDSTGENILLSNKQVALIKLMVINDALATTIARYNNQLGQGQEKNLQRFFPKSERQNYVSAILGKQADNSLLDILETVIKNSSKFMANLVYDCVDPKVLPVDPAINKLENILEQQKLDKLKWDISSIKMKINKNEELDKNENNKIKDLVLGKNGDLLSQWIEFAALAYTDTSGTAKNHYFDNNQTKGRVIRSTAGFTKPQGNLPGAVYEFRETGLSMSDGSYEEVLQALKQLFQASEKGNKI